MKKVTLAAILSILFLGCSMAQTPRFSDLSRKANYPEIRRILNDSVNHSYRHWRDEHLQRDSIIVFLDSTIENVFDIKTNIFQFKSILRSTASDPDQRNYLTYIKLFAGTRVDDLRVNADRSNVNSVVFQHYADTLIYEYVKHIMTFLMIDDYQMDENVIKMSVSRMRSQVSIEILLNYYEEFINGENYKKMPEEMQIRNMKIISSRLSNIQSKNYVLYQSPYAQNKKVKSIELHMDNDVFMLGKNVNQDREYTGGGALAFTTDYLKWRWFNTRWLRDKLFKKDESGMRVLQTRRVMLSYQSIKLGMQFYTPYIRYRSNFDLADTLYKLDRPFASYVYLERSKFRIWSKGLVRSEGNFQIGKVGTNIGRDIQAVLHQDATVSSQKVYGWDKQINNGGRWTIQVNHKIDVMLFSNTNRHISIFNKWFRNNISLNTCDVEYHKRFNTYSSWELFLGTYYTAVGTGLYMSAADFKSQSGQNMLMARKKNIKEYGFNWEIGFKYRRVVHNTTLEGIGFTQSFPDDRHDDESLSPYVIPKDKIRRDLFFLDAKIAVRWRKMTVYYSLSYFPKEYEIDLEDYSSLSKFANANDDDQSFYRNKVIPELQNFNAKKYYGFGRIGVNWIVE